jgi:hypothetical protein
MRVSPIIAGFPRSGELRLRNPDLNHAQNSEIHIGEPEDREPTDYFF